jgi:excisionase family DNA binding protein
MAAENLLTRQQVAERLGVSPRHVYRLIYEYELPVVHVGKQLRFEPTAIDRWVRDRQVTHAVG